MNTRKSILSAAIVASLGFVAPLHAQQSVTTTPAEDSTQETGEPQDATDLGTVTVIGIRGSLEKSLDAKRDANSHVEVVTAEDIGKLPAKNVADTLQRLPGVNISSASAAEGGFDESDRVSLRGTSPSLTQTLVNGHNVGTGDWFVLSQVQTVGRSVSYSLLPAEIVSRVVVQKGSEAKIAEGGSAGSVNIITRRPLQFAETFTAEATVGGVYSDLPGDTKPQINGLFNWKNDAGTAGVLLQGFYEKRGLRRDGQEVVGGYLAIPGVDAAGNPTPLALSNPDLVGVLYPNLIGSTLFEQQRERKGGVLDIQIKPTDTLTLGLNAFYSKLEADNYNRNYMLWNSRYVGATAPLPGYVIGNGVLTQAQYAPIPGSTNSWGVYDQISRPGASSSSQYVTVDADWLVSDNFSLKFQAGQSEGRGKSPTQDVIELGFGAGAGSSWSMNGTGSPIDWAIGGDNASPSGIRPQDGWIFGGQGIDARDQEDWAQADGEYFFSDGVLSTLDFGVRYTEHSRENPFEIAQGPNFASDWQNPAAYPTSFSNYPGDFGNGLGGTYPRDVWFYTPEQLAAINAAFANRDPVGRFYWQDLYSVNEKTGAAYVQANFSGARWSGNLGLRYVRTSQRTTSNVGVNPALAIADQPAGTINGSAFGPYLPTVQDKDYNKLLPSANFKFNLSEDLVLRLGASQTLTRPDYSALAGSVSLSDLTRTGSGGNPNLDPLVSTNFDAALEWYFAPRALLSASLFSMDMKDYVGFGTVTQAYLDQTASVAAGQDVFADYLVSIPVNVDAKVQGLELAYEQPLGDNFGIAANYTYADSSSKGQKPVFGTSRDTYNVSGYFENDKFNFRLSYTYRSQYYAGVSRTDDFFQDDIGNLAASLGYTVNERVSVTLDALNLNDPTLKYSSRVGGRMLPYAFYNNGRQYYLNLRFKF